MKRTGEDILRDAILEADSEVNPGQISDPTMWISLIVALLEAFRNCRNQNTAKRHLKRGSALVEIKIRRALRKEGYKGRDKRRKMAKILAQKGSKLTPEEVEAILDDVNDVSDPPPVDGGLWPAWILVAFVVVGLQSSVQADDLWPVEEANLWPTSGQELFSVNDIVIRSIEVKIDQREIKPVPEPAPQPVPKPVACAQATACAQAAECVQQATACSQPASACSYAGASDCSYAGASDCSSGMSRREQRRERRRARRGRRAGGC